MNHITRQCSNCGAIFTCDKRGRRLCIICRETKHLRTNRRFRKRHAGNCQICNKKLNTLNAKYCRGCFKGLLKGDKSPQWKGGKRKNPDGYIIIYNGSRKHYVLEHRLIWEKENNKKLPKGWVVHHLNGIRDDNRIENLVAMPKRNHPTRTFIDLLQKRIQQLEQLHLPLK